MFSAKVIADSLIDTNRVTSILVRYPRCILAEMNTHTIISKNTSSSRAIPYSREGKRQEWQPMTMREMVMENPYVPIYFGYNKPGMQPGDEMTPEQRKACQDKILLGRDKMVELADQLWAIGMHKGDVNRYIEPWAWTEQLLTSTQWTNFFHLRTSHMAHPAMQRIAKMMYLKYLESKPVTLDRSSWHLPFIDDEDREKFSIEDLLELSVARCARLSYYSFTSGKKESKKDFELFEMLQREGHWSPFGHQAKRLEAWNKISNLKGCLQYRKLFPNECKEEFSVSDETLLVWKAEIESET